MKGGMRHSGWRDSTPIWARDLGNRPRTPPDEPDGPCMAHQCPRTGTVTHAGLVLCSYHRGEDTPRTRRRNP